MTIDELIQQLKDSKLPGDTEVYLANDESEYLTETDETVITTVGGSVIPRRVIAIY